MDARATVIIPTFGNATFARWAIKSVQQQTINDIEICLICDGSPENMISFFKDMEKEDPRLQVFVFPKAPRTGEPYRDIVIKQTTGRIICYCSHDDLWLPHHIEVMEKFLSRYFFTHSIHALVKLPDAGIDTNGFFGALGRISLEGDDVIERMRRGQNYVGLTFGAHTRKSYYTLDEGWVTTPRKDIPTDFYMWSKFLAAYGKHCKTIMKVTALNFQKSIRKDWSEQERNDELKEFFKKMQDRVFLRQIDKLCLKYRLLSYQKKIVLYHKIKTYIRNIFRSYF